jgi:subfamily B ATP-binding cassette protein HlyB/CyaB
MSSNLSISQASFLWALGSLCRLHGKPHDSRLLLQRHPPDAKHGHRLSDILLAAKELGLLVKEAATHAGGDLAHRLPCLAFSVHGETGETSPAVIVHSEGDTLHYHTPDRDELDTCPRHELAQRFGATLYAIHLAPEAPCDQDGRAALADKPFGFTWFIPELLRHKHTWRDILAASLALQLVGLATPLFTQVVIDKVVVHQTQSTLAAVGAGLLLSILFSGVFTWVRQYLVLHTGNRIDAVLGSRVFGHLFSLPMAYFAHRPTGVLVARLQGVETIREFLSGAAVTLILDLPFMVVLLAVMFWYSWQLSLIALGLLLLLALLSFAVSPLFRHKLNRQFLLGARNQAFVTEHINGMETVKSLQLESQLQKRQGSYLADYLAASLETRQLTNSYNTLASTLEQIQSLAVLVAGALLVMNNDGFTIGMLVAFQMFAARLSGPMLRMVGLYQEAQQATLAVQRLGDIMNVSAEPHAIQPSRSLDTQGRIELKNISYRYDDEFPWLFRDFSHTFLPGKTTLIMGPSGSGKSTLAKLLLGFYRPQEGRITLDGQDLRHLGANELRIPFGVVPQETTLFSGTLHHNLALANPQASFDDIVQACKLAEIHDTIETLPQGYQTEIGEHGTGLSGGQKQRIAIARALLKRPKILIFDEAAANLDAATAEHFARTVNLLRGKATILFIAHQVPRGLQVDETVMMGQGGAGMKAGE